MTTKEYRKKYDCDNCQLIGMTLDFAEGPEWFVCGCHNLDSDKDDSLLREKGANDGVERIFARIETLYELPKKPN